MRFTTAAVVLNLALPAAANPLPNGDHVAFCAWLGTNREKQETCQLRAESARDAATRLHNISTQNGLLHKAMHYCAETRLPDWTAVWNCMASTTDRAKTVWRIADEMLKIDERRARKEIGACLQPEPGDLSSVVSCLREAKSSF